MNSSQLHPTAFIFRNLYYWCKDQVKLSFLLRWQDQSEHAQSRPQTRFICGIQLQQFDSARLLEAELLINCPHPLDCWSVINDHLRPCVSQLSSSTFGELSGTLNFVCITQLVQLGDTGVSSFMWRSQIGESFIHVTKNLIVSSICPKKKASQSYASSISHVISMEDIV